MNLATDEAANVAAAMFSTLHRNQQIGAEAQLTTNPTDTPTQLLGDKAPGATSSTDDTNLQRSLARLHGVMHSHRHTFSQPYLLGSQMHHGSSGVCLHKL
jgi:hypothetical protein